jgi:prepilin-type N-terminal cleavage/methylation domain-containing protein
LKTFDLMTESPCFFPTTCIYFDILFSNHMIHKYLRARFAGYSLVEVLVVLAIIGILVSVVLVATNPSRQFGLADDAKRKKDVSDVLGAIDRRLLDAKGLPVHDGPRYASNGLSNHRAHHISA